MGKGVVVLKIIHRLQGLVSAFKFCQGWNIDWREMRRESAVAKMSDQLAAAPVFSGDLAGQSAKPIWCFL